MHIHNSLRSEQSRFLQEPCRKNAVWRISVPVGVALVILCCIPAFGQSGSQTEADPAKNTLHLSGEGMPFFLFLHYERQLITTGSSLVHRVNTGAGGGIWKASSAGGYGVEIAVNILSGARTHHLELMLGVIGAFDQSGYKYDTDNGGEAQRADYFHFLPHGSIGYRYQPPVRGLMFRIGIGFPALHVGVGYSF